jgi:hypothetical protein
VLVARAHVHGHPEWDDVISTSTNALGRSCCGYADAQLLEFDEREPAQRGSYRVKIESTWYSVPPRDITQNAANPTGKAIVWWAHIQGKPYIYCFKPLETW